jgi:hypothetical protein
MAEPVENKIIDALLKVLVGGSVIGRKCSVLGQLFEVPIQGEICERHWWAVVKSCVRVR